ncbi:MAG: hypothetical protein RL701_4165 [Pseudomonadota bacterium]|jgi:phospholipid transport system substrate-binding protein
MAIRLLRPLQIINVLLALAATVVQAQEAPKGLIEATVRDAFKVLRDESLRGDAPRRLQELRRVADRVFDWETMARSSLGAPWRELKPEQRSDFVSVFKELLAQRYMDDIDRFEGSEQMKVTGGEQHDDVATVTTVLTTSSLQQLPIDYKLYKGDRTWKVDDVTIEGVSLVNHYRKTFSQYLVNKSFSDLLQQLKRKLGTHAPSTPAK